jgi:hypothetical protein
MLGCMLLCIEHVYLNLGTKCDRSKNAVFYVRAERLSSCSSKRGKLFSESRMETRMLCFMEARIMCSLLEF